MNIFTRSMFFFVCLFIAQVCYSDVSIDWTGNSGAVTQIDATVVPAGSLAQLIWAGTDDTAGVFDDLSPTVPTGDDEVLATYSFGNAIGFLDAGIANAASEDAPWLLPADSFASRFVYVRIFNEAIPSEGTEWGESGLFGPTTNQNTPGAPDLFDSTAGGFQLTSVVVPEPSTYALMLFAAALFFNPWRFRRR